MKLRIAVKWVLIVMIIGMGVQAGTAVFALVGTSGADSSQAPTATQTETQTATQTQTQNQVQAASSGSSNQLQVETVAATDAAAAEVVLSSEVNEAIGASDPSNYERNVANYKKLLVRLDVHPKFRTEIERLLLAGRKVPDVLIAYEFLYQEFGTRLQLEPLVTQRSSGKTWESIFTEYHQAHAAFVPRAFDMNQLEGITRTSGLSSDDIMIADHLSFVTGKPFTELIAAKLEQKQSWKEAAAELDVLNTSSVLPRVQITTQQINRWTQPGKMTEDQVAEAFVLAGKTGEEPAIVIGKLSSGQTQEAVLAQGYVRQYE